MFSFLFGKKTQVRSLVLSEHRKDLENSIIQGIFDFNSQPWNQISSQAKDLIKSLLEASPQDRISLEDSLGQFLPFFWPIIPYFCP